MARRGVNVFRLRHQGRELLVCSYPVGRSAWLASLTAAELAVAEAILDGATPAEIAAHRHVSDRTVSNQLARIYRKLGVSSRYELVALVSRGRAGE